MTKYNVLSTKKLDPSLIEEAKLNDIEIREEEAIAVRPILTKEKWDEMFQLLKAPIPYAVFTSANAVQAVKKYLSDFINPQPVRWQIFCLSGRTGNSIKIGPDLGAIIATADNATALAKTIIAKGAREVLFFCGDKRREELPTLLEEAGVRVHEVVVYQTVETPVKNTADLDAILFFSPSGVESFFSVNQLKENTVCFAIGGTTADTISRYTNNKTIISEAPTQEMMLAAVLKHLQG